MLAEPSSPDSPPQRLTLDIDRGVEPLSGVLYCDGIGHPFAGWLALASTISRLTDPGMAAPVKDWGGHPGATPDGGGDDAAGADPERGRRRTTRQEGSASGVELDR